MNLTSMAAAALLGLGSLAAAAQTVTFNGHIGTHKALLVIDGEPQTVCVGTTVRGVRLLSLTDAQAEVEVGAARRSWRSAPGGARGTARRAAAATRSCSRQAATATSARSARSTASRSSSWSTPAPAWSRWARSKPIAWGSTTKWRARTARTANGVVPMRVIVLNSVRIGDVEIANVEASVTPGSIGVVLLGNSFLTRFQMRRENDVMRLEKRN